VTNDPIDIGALVPDRFEWHSSPFQEIFRDRQTFIDRWMADVAPNSDVSTRYEILCEAPGRPAVCRYFANYTLHKTAKVDTDGILLVRLDGEGRCELFEEWFFSNRTPCPEYT
jgi:hypothetical protein